MHKFKKSLGQNFLQSSKFPKKIIDILDIKPNEWVIEIGPGDGSLTQELLKSEGKIISIEYDYDLLAKLLRRFQDYSSFNLEHGDFLDINLDLLSQKYKISSLKFCGSLPYNISKKIINKVLKWSMNSGLEVVRCVFIVQEEVSKEYNAKTPKSNFLSTITSIYASVKKHESIPASQFFPKPRVNGGILEFIPHKKNISGKEQLLKIEKFIKIAFSSPRKTLVNNLSSFGIERERVLNFLETRDIDQKIRPGEVEYSTLVELFESIN